MRTYATIVGLQLPDTAGEDSVSLLPLFKAIDKPVRQTAVSQSSRGMLAIRKDHWKLIFGQGSGGWWRDVGDDHPGQLYSLANDLGETKNLFKDYSQVVAELTLLMRQQIENSRSTPGAEQVNDVKVNWKPVD